MNLTTTLLTDDYDALGIPQHFWRYNGGTTRAAILVYVRYMRDVAVFEREPTADELRLITEYCQYFINAPCWKLPPRELAMLRASIIHIKTACELSTWLWGCNSIGIYPL